MPQLPQPGAAVGAMAQQQQQQHIPQQPPGAVGPQQVQVSTGGASPVSTVAVPPGLPHPNVLPGSQGPRPQAMPQQAAGGLHAPRPPTAQSVEFQGAVGGQPVRGLSAPRGPRPVNGLTAGQHDFFSDIC